MTMDHVGIRCVTHVEDPRGSRRIAGDTLGR
jgi:hypothetical protein